MAALFEKYSQTSSKPKSKVLPLNVLKPAPIVFDMILKYLNDDEYEEIKSYKNYLELFCIDGGFEITIHVLNNGDGSSLVDAAVYGENKRGKTRKRLKNFLLELQEVLK